MNIKDIPAEYEVFDRFNAEYERTNFRYTDANQRIGAATRDLFLSWFPRITRPLVRRVIYASMDDALIEAFGFPTPSRFMRWVVTGMLKLRGCLAGMLPARKKPRLRTEMGHPSYPSGYVIEDVGPKSV